jgi:hypothetical protein
MLAGNMASIHRRPESQFWHAAFRGPDGRLILRSTKCADRNKAMAAALELERASKLAGSGNLVEAQARKIVADIMETTFRIGSQPNRHANPPAPGIVIGPRSKSFLK